MLVKQLNIEALLLRQSEQALMATAGELYVTVRPQQELRTHRCYVFCSLQHRLHRKERAPVGHDTAHTRQVHARTKSECFLLSCAAQRQRALFP